MSDQEFTCEHCGGTFKKGWTEEEALAEQIEVFGPDSLGEDRVVVCDDCYEAFMAWFRVVSGHGRNPLSGI